jgi:hypothetical protein
MAKKELVIDLLKKVKDLPLSPETLWIMTEAGSVFHSARSRRLLATHNEWHRLSS